MPTPRLTPELIAAAIEGYESQRTRIDANIRELRAMLPGNRTDGTPAATAPIRKRRPLSSAARKRIAEAQRKRWAAIKRGAAQPSPAERPKPKRRLSAAGRKRIIEATKKRWAALRAAKAAEAKAAANKTSSRKTAKKARPTNTVATSAAASS